MLNLTGLKSFEPIPVIHCHKSFGLVMESAQFGKIVFSGDTRPCDSLIQAGQGATLLIHEATYEQDKLDEARLRRHSTINEAIEVGQK
jgi:ribonuclease Z